MSASRLNTRMEDGGLRMAPRAPSSPSSTLDPLSSLAKNQPAKGGWLRAGTRAGLATASSPDAIIGGDDSVPATLQDATTFRRLTRAAKSEVESRKSEVGSRKSKVGSRKSKVGSRKSEVTRRFGTSDFRLSTFAFRSAFTLTEILIVIGLIVLLLALAVPAFNLISGGKSIEGATNQLSAALGRARAQAIGLQQITGVLLFVDPRTGRQSFAIVQDVSNGAAVPILDAVDADLLPLPAGVGAQFIHDCTFNGSNQRTSDGYIGCNTFTSANVTPANTRTAPIGGVILFDGVGHLVSTNYQLRCAVAAAPSGYKFSQLGSMLFPVTSSPSAAFDLTPGTAAAPPRSQFGLVMYQLDDFTNNGGSQEDPTISGQPYTLNGPEYNEEVWLDNNATPLMINRYNGTLVKGE